MAKPIDARIANALSNDRIGPADLTALIADANLERDRQLSLHQTNGAESFNLALSEQDRDDAAENAERAGRMANALASALQQLDDKLVAKRANEKSQAKEAKRKAAVAERDNLAIRIAAEWPVLIEHVVDILSAITANDERMRMLGLNEASAECIARGIPAHFYKGNISLAQLTKIKLPSFDGERLAWPVPAAPAPAYDHEAVRAKLKARKDKQDKGEDANANMSAFAFYSISHRQEDGDPIEFFSFNPPRARRLHHVPIGCHLTPSEAERLKALGVTVTPINAPAQAIA